MTRYIVMSVPGRRDDGEDTWWFVFDSKRRHTVPNACLRGDQGHLKIAKLARSMNQKAKGLS